MSSTRPANHHRALAAGEGAGQPSNRIFERHNIRTGRGDFTITATEKIGKITAAVPVIRKAMNPVHVSFR